MALIDIGANLAHDSFDDDRQAVLERAAEAGVTQMIVTGSDLDSNRHAMALAAEHPGRCFATAGLHPHHANDWDAELAKVIRSGAAEGAIRAVGETGLDYFRDISPRRAQQAAFAEQLAIAADYQLPVFLHQRDAHADFIDILREHLPALPRAVVHCFTEGRDMLADYLAEDLYIGVTGWICDERRGAAVYEAVAEVPEQRLMIETDCPYLLPRTIRPRPKSRRNEPAYLPWVRDSVAAARGVPPEAVERSTTATAQHFFALETEVTESSTDSGF